MMIIYGTGEPSYLEFHLSRDQKAIPEHGTIYAICDGERRDDYLDEYTFRVMTDGEYYELQASINLAQRLEARRLERLRQFGPFQRALRWLNSQLARKEMIDSLPRT